MPFLLKTANECVGFIVRDKRSNILCYFALLSNMFSYRLLILCLITASAVTCKKEPVREEPFVQRYPGIMEDADYGAAMAPNGEIIFVTSHNGNRFATRLNARGELFWRTQISPFENEPTHTVCDAEGNMYVMGTNIFGEPKPYIEIIKLGDNGNKLWSVLLQDSFCPRRATNMVHLNDSNILVSLQTGYCNSQVAHMLFKIDYSGKIVWQKSFVDQYCLKMLNTADQGFVCISWDKGLNTRKFNKDGVLQWELPTPWFNGNGTINAMKEMADGSMVVAGRNVQDGQDVLFAFKLAPTGESLWYQTKNYQSAEDVAFAIEEDLAGNIYLGGVTRGHGSEAQGILLKLDTHGKEIWHKLIGGTNKDWACSLLRNSANEIMVLGNTWSFPDQTSTGKVFIMRMDENGYFH
jgi:hypothetical protein